MTLLDLKMGEEGTVLDFIDENAHLRRLREMGMSKGTRLRMVRYAPLGDPIEIEIRGFHLSIRKVLAGKIMIEKRA